LVDGVFLGDHGGSCKVSSIGIAYLVSYLNGGAHTGLIVDSCSNHGYSWALLDTANGLVD
jgi:hypothetical protein